MIRTLFWLEESSIGGIHLFQLAPNELSNNYDAGIAAENDTFAHYNPSDAWPLRPPVAIYFDAIVNDFMQEWAVRQQEYLNHEITREEYLEWKFNWPYTCDDLGKTMPSIPWRKNK